MRLMSRVVEPETKMPTMEDLHKLATETNERVDRMEEKLENIHADLRVAIRGLMESFQNR